MWTFVEVPGNVLIVKSVVLFLTLMIAVHGLASASVKDSDKAACQAEATRVLGAKAQALTTGDLTGEHGFECLAVVPYSKHHVGTEMVVKRGVLLRRIGAKWQTLLSFGREVRNERGYIGVDFLDDSPAYGFNVSTSQQRSDGTKGFTLFLTWLSPALDPEGIPIQVSWNSKVHRFQEYAPNELDPPDFKPEVPHPPKRHSPGSGRQ